MRAARSEHLAANGRPSGPVRAQGSGTQSDLKKLTIDEIPKQGTPCSVPP
jgi:hypothetical protein